MQIQTIFVQVSEITNVLPKEYGQRPT